MKNQLATTALSAAIALTVVACGPSGSGGLAGIGGSGYVSSGSVTGFGSVFVNGVEFETDSATFDVDGASGTQDDLAIGMIVKVSGSINDDGISGTATSISFDDEIQGPVTDILPVGNDLIKQSFSVLGTTVIIDSGSTTFDGLDFGSIRNNNNVEVSGFFDKDGIIQATRVELKDIDFVDNVSIVEAKGLIKNVSGTTFDLGDNIESPRVNASNAAIEDLPNGLVNDQLVEVKGTYDTASDTINATEVEGEDDSFDDTDEFELEGLVSGYTGIDSLFKIGNISVDASNAEFEPITLSLADDLRIEAEGSIVNGVLIATEIELEGGYIKVHAPVLSVDVVSSTFQLTPVTGESITVTVTTDTQLEDDVTGTEPYTLVDLFNNGGFVEVQGYDDGNGGITATEVEVKESSDVVVQGYATDVTNTTMTVLGVTFDYDATTKFEDENDMSITDPSDIQDLIDRIAATLPLIKIQDDSDLPADPADGLADEIEIETP